MRRAPALFLFACLPIAAQVAPIPTPTQLPGTPFSIKKQWIIGGTGSWDYLTLDTAAQRLYIAHGRIVQVVDLNSGSVVGEISGFREAHQIALDDTGTYGYVSDGRAGAVAVFDRRTFEVESRITIGCSPRSIAYEPQSKLVFAICSANPAVPPPSSNLQKPVTSHVIAIDAESNTVLADMIMGGDFRFAQADGRGQVDVIVYPAYRFRPQQIAELDGPAIAAEAHRRLEADSQKPSPGQALVIDWSEKSPPGSLVHFLVPAACQDPQSIAVDSKNSRIFAACNDQQLVVLNASNGLAVTTLTTGPGDDVIGYDPDRELIFSANGAGYGSLTIIQQDANTDTYAVIQNLPTLARARTLAVDPSSGNVYLVTDYMGVDLSPRGSFTTIKPAAIAGSFQVLVVGR